MITRTAAWSADPRTNSASQLAEAGERVVHPDVALCGVAGQQGDHGAGDAGRRADRVAASRRPPAGRRHEAAGSHWAGGPRPSSTTLRTGSKASGRSRAGGASGRAEQVRVAERPVDCRNHTPQQSSRVAEIAGGRDMPAQLRPAVLVVQAEERQAEQEVQIVAAWRVTAGSGDRAPGVIGGAGPHRDARQDAVAAEAGRHK